MKKVIGVDLGGTGIEAGVIDEKGRIISQISSPSDGQLGRKAVLDRIRRVVDQLMDDDISAIGLGSPGFVDVDQGRILSLAGNIRGWAHTDLKGELGKYYDLPIAIGNDANLAALCEAWLGAGKDLETFIMITLGTGVGGAIYSRDQGLWLGHQYEGAELGHSILYPGGRECSCGQRGCVERYISGKGLEENYYSLREKSLGGEEIIARLEVDQEASLALDSFMDDLAVFLVSLKNTFDPQGIIIGGGLINAQAYWWEEVKERYRRACNSPGTMKILPASYLNQAGMIGAAKLAFLHMERNGY